MFKPIHRIHFSERSDLICPNDSCQGTSHQTASIGVIQILDIEIIWARCERCGAVELFKKSIDLFVSPFSHVNGDLPDHLKAAFLEHARLAERLIGKKHNVPQLEEKIIAITAGYIQKSLFDQSPE